jgi:hypothetical protein
MFPDFASERVVRVGSADDPNTALTHFDRMAIGLDGWIYTLHPRVPEILIHGPDGSPLGSFGREGEGPGEFTRPIGVGVLGDTVWVTDRGSSVSYFSVDGDLIRTERFPTSLGDAPSYPTHVFSGGRLLFSSGFDVAQVQGNDSVGAPVLRGWSSTTGNLHIDTLFVLYFSRLFFTIEGSSFPFTEPWNDAPVWLPSPVSDRIYVLDRASTGAPSAMGTFTINAFDTRQGMDTVFSTPVPFFPTEVTEALMDSVASELADQFSQVVRLEPAVPTKDRRSHDTPSQCACGPGVGGWSG